MSCEWSATAGKRPRNRGNASQRFLTEKNRALSISARASNKKQKARPMSSSEKANLKMMRDRRMQILAESQVQVMANQAMILHSMASLSKQIDGINAAQLERERIALCHQLEHINDLIENGLFVIDPH
jgi:hypothetical protein